MYFLIYYFLSHIALILAAGDINHLYSTDQLQKPSEDVTYVLMHPDYQEMSGNIFDVNAVNSMKDRLKRSDKYQEGNVPTISVVSHSDLGNNNNSSRTSINSPTTTAGSSITNKVTKVETIKNSVNDSTGTLVKQNSSLTSNSSIVKLPSVVISNNDTKYVNNSSTINDNVKPPATGIVANTSVVDNLNNTVTNVTHTPIEVFPEASLPSGYISFPGDINETMLNQHNISQKIEDNHIYYNSTRINNATMAKHYWVDVNNLSTLLSSSYRRASTVKLPFKFLFYGHEIENVTIATGGFIYTGDFVHSWLAATQYIAPLMANFDTSLSNYSCVKYGSNATRFTVLWENVILQDKPKAGNFTFQVSLQSNGDIIFVYKDIPDVTGDITEDFHPVKVGLSDAYILDRTIFHIRRKTIFEYHRIHFDKKDLSNWTVIYLKPRETCMNRTTCESCLAGDMVFKCQWCDNRCSTGVDRNRHDWMKKDCDRRKINDQKQCGGNIAENIPVPGAHKASKNSDVNVGKSSAGVVFLMIFIGGLVTSMMLWTFYAYRNPHSTSGQLLIKYRPSQWSSWRKGEARYTAATIHM